MLYRSISTEIKLKNYAINLEYTIKKVAVHTDQFKSYFMFLRFNYVHHERDKYVCSYIKIYFFKIPLIPFILLSHFESAAPKVVHVFATSAFWRCATRTYLAAPLILSHKHSLEYSLFNPVKVCKSNQIIFK